MSRAAMAPAAKLGDSQMMFFMGVLLDGGAEPHLAPFGVGASRARFGVFATVGNYRIVCQ